MLALIRLSSELCWFSSKIISNSAIFMCISRTSLSRYFPAVSSLAQRFKIWLIHCYYCCYVSCCLFLNIHEDYLVQFLIWYILGHRASIVPIFCQIRDLHRFTKRRTCFVSVGNFESIFNFHPWVVRFLLESFTLAFLFKGINFLLTTLLLRRASRKRVMSPEWPVWYATTLTNTRISK